MRKIKTDELTDELIGERVKILGWIEDKRPVGKLLFLTLRDHRGKVQLIVRSSGSAWSICERVPRQSVVEVTGTVKKAVDKLEVEVEGFKILSAAKHPLPIDPTGRTRAMLPTILDSRPLSLRIPEVGAIFKIRSEALRLIREFLYERGFLEVSTPKIIATATEGGANLFTVDYFGRKAYLAQSPQLYKEQLMLCFDGVFEVAQYFRAEKSHTPRHLTEFTSVDVEVAFSDYFDVMDLIEDLTKFLLAELRERCRGELEVLRYRVPTPPDEFRKLTYGDALEILRGGGVEVEWGEDFGAEELRMLGEKFKTFYFIYDWPRRAKPFYIKAKGELTESFDFMYSDLELASGGTRENERVRLERRLVEDGLDLEEFKEHLRFFDYGMPPHAGFGLGLDRLMLVLTGRRNVREVTLYPRDPERLTP